MRIDLTTNSMPELERSQGSASSSKSEHGPANGVSPNADDVARLSTSSDAVASFRAQLDSVPEVRQQQVGSLRQAISTGQFAVSPERIADGMLADGVFSAQ